MSGLTAKLRKRLEATGRDKRNLSPASFKSSVSSMGKRSRIFRLRAETANKILGRESDSRLELAIPAYESFTTNGTQDDTESFDLAYEPLDNPNTQNVVVWLDGTYYGAPDNADVLSTGSIDVTDPDTASTVHVWYFPNKAGTIEIQKAIDGSTSTTKNLETFSAKSLHQKNLSEEPEFFDFRDSGDDLEAFIAGDMTLDVYIDVPYLTRYATNDGAHATNALLNFSTLQARDRVPGLKDAVTASM